MVNTSQERKKRGTDLVEEYEGPEKQGEEESYDTGKRPEQGRSFRKIIWREKKKEEDTEAKD